MQKYIFQPYSKRFQQLFKREKEKLKKLLPPNTKIEHIGSTAVPNLGGKGIIDIIISYKNKEIKKIKNTLIREGYEFKPKAGDKQRLFFQKDYKYRNNIRRVHLHLTTHNSLVWKRCTAVKEYLKKYLKEAKGYEEIKKKAVKICEGEGKIYRSYKKDFLNELTKKALRGKRAQSY